MERSGHHLGWGWVGVGWDGGIIQHYSGKNGPERVDLTHEQPNHPIGVWVTPRKDGGEGSQTCLTNVGVTKIGYIRRINELKSSEGDPCLSRLGKEGLFARRSG